MKQIENIISIPGDGNCLFWTLALGYLEPIKTNNKSFTTRYEKLFGKDSKEAIAETNDIILNYDKKNTDWLLNTVLKDKINIFRENLVNFIETASTTQEHLETIKNELSGLYNREISSDDVKKHLQTMRKPTIFGTNLEVKFASEYLNTLIKVYIVNDKNEYQYNYNISLKEPKNQKYSNTIAITNEDNKHFQLIDTFSKTKQNILTNNTPNILKSEITKKSQVNFDKESKFILQARLEITKALTLNKCLTANEIKETTNIYIDSFKQNEEQAKEILKSILNDIKKQVETYNEFEKIKEISNSPNISHLNKVKNNQLRSDPPTPFIKS